MLDPKVREKFEHNKERNEMKNMLKKVNVVSAVL